MEAGVLIQIVHFHQTNTGGLIHATHDRGVVTWWQCCDNRRLPWVCWSIAAVPDVLNLIAGDYPADDRMPPVIVRGDQSPSAIMQLQRWIRQWSGHAKLAELGANGPHNHPFWLSPLNNETAYHYIVAGLHKAASANVAQG